MTSKSAMRCSCDDFDTINYNFLYVVKKIAEKIMNNVIDKSYLTIISSISILNSKGFKRRGTSKNL